MSDYEYDPLTQTFKKKYKWRTILYNLLDNCCADNKHRHERLVTIP